jgi:SAM-dependent methyltransferase
MTISFRRIGSYFKKKFHVYESRNWKEIEYFDESWKKRINCMAQLIDQHSKSVLDLGCGKCWLKDILPADVKYIGVDYKPRECDNNIVCDFNAGEFPNVFTDVVFCSGVLEYIEELPTFVKKICTITDQVILSYCSTDFTGDLGTRISRGWKNHSSSLDMIALFLKNDFLLSDISQEIPGHMIIKLLKNKR